jgi:hypothetical protein
MAHFDVWLRKNKYLSNEKSIFAIKVPENTPFWIIAWIMSQYVYVIS